MLVLDSGAVSALVAPTAQTAATVFALREEGLWPPVVPTTVLVECLRGDPARDARTNLLLKGCEVVEDVPLGLARRAARLRQAAGRGSAVDALITALAEPGGVVLTSDVRDVRALAAHATDVAVRRV